MTREDVLIWLTLLGKDWVDTAQVYKALPKAFTIHGEHMHYYIRLWRDAELIACKDALSTYMGNSFRITNKALQLLEENV